MEEHHALTSNTKISSQLLFCVNLTHDAFVPKPILHKATCQKTKQVLQLRSNGLFFTILHTKQVMYPLLYLCIRSLCSQRPGPTCVVCLSPRRQ